MSRACTVLVLVIIGLSCLVDRRSGDFACDVDADCAGLDGQRVCTNGYCLPETCPSICDDCDPGKICKFDCTSVPACRNNVTCPAGYHCQITCEDDCMPVCTNAQSCQVTCETGATCACPVGPPCTCIASGGICL